MDRIQENLARAEADFDTPFDQLYHKERKLIQDIIRAEKAIKQLTEKLPDPAEFMRFDPKDIDHDEIYGDLYSDMEPQYIKDKRNAKKLSSRKSQTSLFDQSEDVRHQYNEQA